MKKILGLAVACCLLPALVMADDAWQREEAIGIVNDLRASLNKIVDAPWGESAQQVGVQSKKTQAALVDIRFLIEELERLDLALTAGSGKAQTYARYKKISNIRYSITDYTRDSEFHEDARNEAEVARHLMRKLDLMYF